MTGKLVVGTVALVCFAAGASPAPAGAQEPACTYDACAVRLQTRFFGGTRLVQGASQQPISRNGFFALRIDAFASAGDSVRLPYERYRGYAQRGGVLALLSGVAGGLAYYYYDRQGDESMGTVFVASGLVLGLVSAYNVSKGTDHLNRAIWAYNRQYAR